MVSFEFLIYIRLCGVDMGERAAKTFLQQPKVEPRVSLTFVQSPARFLGDLHSAPTEHTQSSCVMMLAAKSSRSGESSCKILKLSLELKYHILTFILPNILSRESQMQ